ncbi:MAG: DUF2752 domain-containing protein [Planctomycetota bacterium]
MTDVRISLRARLIAAGVAAACAALLLTASLLKADDAGHGTHEQLGLPACGWAVSFNSPCMTCGMTTAFTHAADGKLWQSFVTQPMGMLLSVGTAATFWLGLFVAVTGSRLGEHLVRLLTTRMLIVGAALGGGAWVYKVIVWNGGV